MRATDVIKRVSRWVTSSIDSSYSVLAGRRRVFIATWTEGKNFGDDYLRLAIEAHLTGRRCTESVIATDLTLDGRQPTKSDVSIIGGGGLWGPSGTGTLADGLYRRWATLEGGLVIANIGIESYNSSSAAKMQCLARKAALFTVRDVESWSIAAEVVGEDCVWWGADNTYLAPLLVTRRPEPGLIGVNLCGPEQEAYSHPYSMEHIHRSLGQLRQTGYKFKAVVFCYNPTLSNYPHCARLDPDCQRDFTTGPYEECEVFIGMHFHSVLLSLQNGIPTIAVSYSGKVRRLMREYALDEYCIEPEDPDMAEKLLALAASVTSATVRSKIASGNAAARARILCFEQALDGVLYGT